MEYLTFQVNIEWVHKVVHLTPYVNKEWIHALNHSNEMFDIGNQRAFTSYQQQIYVLLLTQKRCAYESK